MLIEFLCVIAFLVCMISVMFIGALFARLALSYEAEVTYWKAFRKGFADGMAEAKNIAKEEEK